MKKLFAVLLALTLVLSMGTIALAAGTGTIKISNAIKDAEYTVYKMFNFEPVGNSTTEGRYTVADEKWTSFVNNEASAYLAFDANSGTIKWVGSTVEKDGVNVPADVEVSALAKAAVAYAKDKGIAPAATSKTATADGEITFTVSLGYYAIDTSLGTICALTNVNNEFVAHEKNAKPDLEKKVQEDLNGEWGATNDADIGQEVNFKATVKVAKGSENYIMHDKMSSGLTFKEIKSVTANGQNVAHEVKTSGTCDTECDFEIVFDNNAVAALEAGTEIVVEYTATLNKDAVIAGEGNPNEAYISYGEDSQFESTPSKTTTYTYQFQLVKTVADGTVLPGAKFKLYNAETGGKEILVVKESEGVYRVATEGEKGVEIEAGYVTIKGLDSDTYYLEETFAPEGYNKLATRKSVVINAANNNATVETNKYVSGGVQVINKTGSLLPETGGIGTTIFYIVGITLMLGAGIILISKKRMASFA